MAKTEIEEVVEQGVEAKLPSQWKVLLHNDDKTTFQFVIEILMVVFRKDFNHAVTITQSIHDSGIGIAGYYSQEIAEEKASEVYRLARQNGFPLTATFEEA